MPTKPSTSFLTFCWRGVASRVAVTRNHRIEGWTLIVVSVIVLKGASLPFALHGAKSFGIEEEEIASSGGCPSSGFSGQLSV